MNLHDHTIPHSLLPIGIFDSGVGGVTVLRELQSLLPNENFIYFADKAHLPYGDKTPQQINGYVKEILAWMHAQPVKLVVMACNTSSAVLDPYIIEQYPTPMINTIAPTAIGVKRDFSQLRSIVVLATSRTAFSGVFEKAFAEIQHQATITTVACPEFVPLLEGNASKSALEAAVERIVAPIASSQEYDGLIYGCTHYPLLHDLIVSYFPKDAITIINPAYYIANTVKQYLLEHRLLNPQESRGECLWHAS